MPRAPAAPRPRPDDGPPGLRLTAAVALMATTVLVQEVALHRLFSVLFFRHGAFLAVGTALGGLALGAAWLAPRLEDRGGGGGA